MKALVTGGGTAGHVYPALSVIEELRERIHNIELVYFGTADGIESRLAEEAGVPFFPVRARGFSRRFSLSIFGSIFALVAGFADSYRILRKEEPDLILGTGGYVTAPVLLAGGLRRIPFIIHEQNSVPGLVNRFFGRFAEAVAISFPGTESYFPARKKVVLTGNPIRKSILKSKRPDALSFFGFEDGIQTVLVLGGSRGAKSLNDAVIDALEHLKSFRPLQLIHLTGEEDFERVQAAAETKLGGEAGLVTYRPYPYLEMIGLAYTVSDVVISRAGATTIAETTAYGLPSVLVPYPYASESHQEKNARVLEELGVAKLIPDSELSGETLFKHIQCFAFNEAALSRMRERAKEFGRLNAAAEIVNLILGLKASREAVSSYSQESDDDAAGW